MNLSNLFELTEISINNAEYTSCEYIVTRLINRNCFNVIDKEFLFFFLLSHRDEFIKMGGGGAQPDISKEKILNTYIPLPPFTEQKRIVSAVRKAFVQLDTIMESL